MSNSEQEQIELETRSLEHAVVMGEAWNRLQRNSDFKKVILKGYCESKAMASVSLLAVPQIKEKGHRPDVMEDLVAISNLQYYFKIIEHEYEGATSPILSDEEEEEIARLEAQENIDAAGGVN